MNAYLYDYVYDYILSTLSVSSNLPQIVAALF